MSRGSGKRPFWMHQLVEYIFGVGLVALGTQSPTPVVPAVIGLVLMFYAACTKGALSAFNVLPRGVHRWCDPLMALAMVLAGAQPWADVEFAARGAMIAMAAVYLFVWWQSDFDHKVPAPKRGATTPATSPASSPASSPAPSQATGPGPSVAAPAAALTTDAAGRTATGTGDRATDMGRTAGRVVGTGVTMFRKARAKAKQKD